MVQPSTSADTPSSGPTQALPVQPDAVLPITPTPAQAKTAPAVPTTDAQPEASVAAQPVETKSGAASVRARATPSPESRHDEPERTTRSRPEERPTPQKSAPSRQPPSDSGTSATAPAEPSRSQAPQPEASSSTDAVGRSSRSAGEGTPGRSGQPSSSSSPPAARADALSTYVATVGQYLERHKEYPRQARLQLIEGRVSLRIVVAADGSVVSYRVDRSSGYGILDRAARRMVKRAAPLPPPPEELGRNDLQLIVPVSFRLR
ncbi:MAG: TonB family protein [Ectothiorhodospiraceae bacterium]